MTERLIEEFKNKLRMDREHSAAHSGANLLMSETGPVGFGAIEALFRVVEAQQAEIEGLRNLFEELRGNVNALRRL